MNDYFTRNLRDMDIFSKSDPMCVVFYAASGSTEWTEYQRTECIVNTLNPDFATKITLTYHFELQQRIKICIYDIDDYSDDLSRHDFIGEYECTLVELVTSYSLLHRGFCSRGVLAALVSDLPKEVASRWNGATTCCSRWEFWGPMKLSTFWNQVEYNPGTGFLTDDSGVVLHYHRRDELTPVGRILISSSDQGSTLCASSCLSSQVENHLLPCLIFSFAGCIHCKCDERSSLGEFRYNIS